MDESEFRRQCLRRLVDRFGRGGIARIARELNISPTYVSRLLSDPSSNQHRSITGEMVLAINKAFPDWLTAPPSPPVSSAGKPAAAAFSDEERAILEGFRNADGKDRETMLFLARRATEVFNERAGKQ